MKIHLHRTDELRHALRQCETIIDGPDGPEDQVVLLRAQDGAILLAASDGRTMIEAPLFGTIDGEGAAAFDAHPLSALLAALPWGNADITADDTSVEITTDHFTYRPRRRLSATFETIEPQAPDPEDAEMAAPLQPLTFHMDGDELLRLINRTFHTIDRHNSRWYIQGLYLKPADSRMFAVGTDGHRIACASVAMPPGAADMKPSIIPWTAILALRDLVWANIDIAVTQSGDTIRFDLHGEDTSIITRPIAAKYVNYEPVIAATPWAQDAGRLTVSDPRTLAQILDAIPFGGGANTAVTIHTLGGWAVLRSPLANVEVRLSPDVATWHGAPPPDRGAFQARYLRDICRAADTRFTFQPAPSGEERAMIHADDLIMSLMPVRLP